MSDMNYENIKTAWENEVENDALQDLADLRLSKMISHLSNIRLSLASTDADKPLQAELLTQEALNLEFMLEDLLTLRREKILKSVLVGRRPTGDMTLSEEEFYNRIQRAFDGHSEFMKDSLAGTTPTESKKGARKRKSSNDRSKKSTTEEYEETELIVVRFLQPIDEAFMGLDERTYGPFKKEEIATIPAANARRWLRDGIVTRVILEDGVRADEG